MASTSLMDLPAELHLEIMSQVSRPKDLFSLTSASSTYWRLFGKNKATVMKSVARLAFSSENMHLAMKACAAPVITSISCAMEPSSEFAGSSDTNEIEQGPLGLEEDCDAALASIETDSQLWERLFRLARMIDILIDEFAHTALREFRDGLAPFSRHRNSTRKEAFMPTTWPLTISERYRVQRAFLLFEITRKMFMTAKYGHGWHSSSTNFLFERIFMEHLSSLERSGLPSIYEFLRDRVIKIMDQVEDFFVEAAQQACQIEMSHPADVPTGCDHLYLSEENLDLHCLSFFERSQMSGFMQQEQADFMVALGLPFLQDLQKYPVAEHACIMKSNYPSRGANRLDFQYLFHDCMWQSKGYDLHWNSPSDVNSGENTSTVVGNGGATHSGVHWHTGTAASVNDPDQANPAGQRATSPPGSRTFHACYSGGRMGLASFGLTFWDQERLEAAGLFEMDAQEFERCATSGKPNRWDKLDVMTQVGIPMPSFDALWVVALTLFEHYDVDETLYRAEY